jgi:iron complex transport system substrate-binding protein
MRHAATLALVLWSGCAAAAPARVAPARVVSLNLCTDELALLLAAPGQLVSVSRLGAAARETTLSARARGLATNNGNVTDVVALAPDLVITSGGARGGDAVARRLGIAALVVPPPETLADVRANIRTVAAALGRPAQGAALIADIDTVLAAPAPPLRRALLVEGGGVAVAANGLAADWLRHAGLIQQNVPHGAISLEALLAAPPAVLVTTDYHPGETSINAAWLRHPAFARLPQGVARLTTDGRAWTCLGPPLALEIARLRARAAEIARLQAAP